MQGRVPTLSSSAASFSDALEDVIVLPHLHNLLLSCKLTEPGMRGSDVGRAWVWGVGNTRVDSLYFDIK